MLLISCRLASEKMSRIYRTYIHNKKSILSAEIDEIEARTRIYMYITYVSTNNHRIRGNELKTTPKGNSVHDRNKSSKERSQCISLAALVWIECSYPERCHS